VFLEKLSLNSKTLTDGQVEVHVKGNKSMTVRLNKKIDMPTWNPNKRLNRKAELDAWEAMIVQLKAHEQEHAKIGEAWRVKLQELSRNINFTVTGQKQKEAMQKAKDEIAGLQSQWLHDAQKAQVEIDPFEGTVLNCPVST
jgi:predicted secreted Zn-dependent protease